MPESFNLLDQPWILVTDLAGIEREVSIVDLFEQAPRLASIDGDVPTQTFAITRLLLAILHRSLDGPRDVQAWGVLWSSDRLPLDAIYAYLERYRHRFELFDDSEPFFQVADLRSAKSEVSSLNRIVADVPNNEPMFTTRAAPSLREISPSEAARWLVHVHAFDPSGIKSGAVGDPMVKGGRGYPIGTGWSGQLGGVLVQGVTLKETILLNLVSYDQPEYVKLGGPDDLPPWERVPLNATWSEREPGGAIDLYTWQTRRVRLVPGGDGVTGVVLANGDKIVPHNRQLLDPHTAWRYSEPQSKKAKTVVFMPRMHAPERSIWKGIGAMLPATSGLHYDSGSQPKPYLAPGVLQFLSDAERQGVLNEAYVIRTRAIGMSYGVQSATTDDLIDDSLALSVALIREHDPSLGQAAVRAVDAAEEGIRAVVRLAVDLDLAAGSGPDSGAADRAREQASAQLDGPYREWLSRIGPESSVHELLAEWQRAAARALLLLADGMLRSTGPAAWTGRKVGDRLVNAPQAEMFFRSRLRKALPLAHSPAERDPTEVNA